jgi:hypothetical protein
VKEFNAYIDESGDEGFQFEKGSSSWFVLAAAVVDSTQDLSVASSINRIKHRLWPRKSGVYQYPLHWKDLGHPQKKVVIQELTGEDFILLAVAFDKEHPKFNRDRLDPRRVRARTPRIKSALYFYAARFLVERICKFAKHQAAKVNLIFENRSSLSVTKLTNYLDLVGEMPGPYGRPTIPIDRIGNIEAESKQVRKLLQVVDACAGAIFNALETDKYGNVEATYVLDLANKFDRVSGKLWGYGLKLFPGNKPEYMQRSTQYTWMDKI